MILAGDVGGTKTNLGLFDLADGRLVAGRMRGFPSADYPSLEAIVEEFLAAGDEAVDRTAVGVAGPVVDGRSYVVNLRWPVDARRLADTVGHPVTLLNDLEANAWGIPELTPDKYHDLTPDLEPGRGNAALIAAGTGLGMAIVFRDGDRWLPSASEGGHQEFAPRDESEVELWRWLRARHGRVSIERAVSGPGIFAIYQFLVDRDPDAESQRMRDVLATASDANAAVSNAGLDGSDALARRALDLFVSLYGSAAGDLALVARATGGVWIGGGIAPRIAPRLESGEFVRAFRSKGRLTPLLEKIPIRVILEPLTALIGAAACAARGPAPVAPDS